VFVAASAALLALHGNHGLWIALLIFMATRGVTLARYLPGMSREIAAA
jgi:MATE family multidrug resistance protein